MRPDNHYTSVPEQEEEDPDDKMEPKNNDGCGCSFTGCFTMIILFFLFLTILFGLRVPGGTLHIDIIPPGIRWYPAK